MHPNRTSGILSRHQRLLNRGIIVLVMRLNSRRRRSNSKRQLKRRKALWCAEVSIFVDDLQEAVVELLLGGGIFEDTVGDTIE